MKIRKNISTRFSGDLYVSSVDSSGDGLEISKQFAACKSCGSILSIRGIRLCVSCRGFLCRECIFTINTNIFCKECVEQLYPLQVYEYAILRFIDYIGSATAYDITYMLGIPLRSSRLILSSLANKGYIVSRGWLIRRYIVTVQGHAVMTLYRRIYRDFEPFQ